MASANGMVYFKWIYAMQLSPKHGQVATFHQLFSHYG